MFSLNKKKKLSMNVNYWNDPDEVFNNQKNALLGHNTKKKPKKNNNLSLYPRQDIAVNRFTKYDSDISSPAISHLDINKKLNASINIEKYKKKGFLLFHQVGSGKTITSLVSAMNMFSYGEPMFNDKDIGNYVLLKEGRIIYIHPDSSGPKYKHGLRDDLDFKNHKKMYNDKDSLSCSVEYKTTWCYNQSFKDILDEYINSIDETIQTYKDDKQFEDLLEDLQKKRTDITSKIEGPKGKIINEKCLLKCKGLDRSEFKYVYTDSECHDDWYDKELEDWVDLTAGTSSKTKKFEWLNRWVGSNTIYDEILINILNESDNKYLKIEKVNKDLITFENGLVIRNPEENREITIVTPTGIFENFRKEFEETLPGFNVEGRTRPNHKYYKKRFKDENDHFYVRRKFIDDKRTINFSIEVHRVLVRNILH